MGRRWPSRPPHGCSGHARSSWYPATLGCGIRSPRYSATLGRGGALSSLFTPPPLPPVHPLHVATIGTYRRSGRACPPIVHRAGMRVTNMQRLRLPVSGYSRVVAAKKNSHLAEGQGRSLARYGPSRLGNFVGGREGSLVVQRNPSTAGLLPFQRRSKLHRDRAARRLRTRWKNWLAIRKYCAAPT